MSSKRKLTRGDREALEENFGENFSTNQPETYGQMSEEEKDGILEMSAHDAKRTLFKKRSADREKIEKAVAEAEPAWLTEQKNSPPAETNRRTFTGPGVVDTGEGSVLINPPTGEGVVGKDGEPGADGAASAIVDHMWLTALDSVDESGTGTLSVLGGVVVVQGTRIEVEDTTVTSSDPFGFIVLKVERESASRAIKEGYPPEIQFFDDLSFPDSSESSEYTVLAEATQVVTPAPTEEDPSATVTTYTIRQCRNDEICSYELLIVANGEFKLLPFQTNSRNSYAPPVPSP